MRAWLAATGPPVASAKAFSSVIPPKTLYPECQRPGDGPHHPQIDIGWEMLAPPPMIQ